MFTVYLRLSNDPHEDNIYLLSNMRGLERAKRFFVFGALRSNFFGHRNMRIVFSICSTYRFLLRFY